MIYALVVHAIPVQRCQMLIADVTGAKPSAGFVHGMLARAPAALARFEALVKTLITLSRVVHFDETTLRFGAQGSKRYVWMAGTDNYAAYHLGGRDTGFTLFGIGHGSAGITAHDRLLNPRT